MVIFNEAKPKYEKLDEILEEPLHDIKFTNHANIIIDIKEIARKFFRPDIMPNLQNSRNLIEEISSDIIGVISHYRNYFFKNGKTSTFYLLYSFGKCEEIMKIYPNYKKDYYSKHFNSDDSKADLITKSLRVVQITSKAIPNVYFIDTTKFDELLYCRYLISKINKNELTIILTNDSMFYQLLSDNVFSINLKGIHSELISSTNCLKEFTKDETVALSTASIPIILALSGDKKYSITSIPSVAITKATAIVEKLISEGKCVDADSISIPIEFSKLNPRNRLEDRILKYKEELCENYKLIRNDELFFKNKDIMAVDLVFNKEGDLKTKLLSLNAKFFTMHPLQLSMLLKGEKL